MKSYFAIEKFTKNGKTSVKSRIENLSIKDAEIIGREMGIANADIIKGKIENKDDISGYQFFNAFASAFFMATIFYAPKHIKEETQRLFNESLFKVEESAEEKENKNE